MKDDKERIFEAFDKVYRAISDTWALTSRASSCRIPGMTDPTDSEVEAAREKRPITDWVPLVDYIEAVNRGFRKAAEWLRKQRGPNDEANYWREEWADCICDEADRREGACLKCHGDGLARYDSGPVMPCGECRGSGRVKQ